MIRAASLCLVLLAATVHAAEDHIQLDETVISGNQELPRVLYVQPWQSRSGAVPVLAPRIDLSELARPVYPHEFRRQLQLEAQFAESNPPTEK